jgi:hypothetical protein
MHISVTRKCSETPIDFLETQFVIDEACNVFTFQDHESINLQPVPHLF